AGPPPLQQAAHFLSSAAAVVALCVGSSCLPAPAHAAAGSWAPPVPGSLAVAAREVEEMSFEMPSYGAATGSSDVKLNRGGDGRLTNLGSPSPAPAPAPVPPGRSVSDRLALPSLDAQLPKLSAPRLPKLELPAAPKAPAMSKSVNKGYATGDEKAGEFKPVGVAPLAKPKAPAPAPAKPKFEAPALPKFEAPALPKFEAPALPKFDAPKAPDMSAFKAPDMSAFKAPDLSKLGLDSISAPAMPKIDVPKMPKFSMPAMPDMPKMPDMPAVKGGGPLRYKFMCPYGGCTNNKAKNQSLTLAAWTTQWEEDPEMEQRLMSFVRRRDRAEEKRKKREEEESDDDDEDVTEVL
ncbi:hypothetical protein TeGR_g349, partial [Tetraparma gracilis]